jgi:peptide/nickel transport system substrate-binding protein
MQQAGTAAMFRRIVCLLFAFFPLGTAMAAGVDTLRVGVTALPASYGDPYRAVGVPGALVWNQLFNGLTEQDAEGRILPALAIEWEMLSPTEWRFELRRNVKFSSGRSFDAKATAAVFDWLASDEGRATIVGNELRGVRNVIAEESHTLKIITEQPDPILPNRLTMVMIVDMAAWLETGRSGFTRSPHGTGSYQLIDWQNANGAALLKGNPHAWRPPEIENVEIYPLRDHAARFQAAISGQLHAVMSLRPEQLDAFRERGFAIHVDQTRQINSLAFDVEGHPDSPIGDVRVRRALNYAIDVQAIAEKITAGTAPPASQGSAPGVFGYNPALSPYPYAPEEARRLLAEAGYPDGFELTATVVTGTYPNDIEMYAKVQQDLAAIGVRITMEATIFADWIQQYVFGDWRSEAFSLAWNTSPYNDAIRPLEYFSCRKSRPFFCDPATMPILDAAATELDRDRRESLLKELATRYYETVPSLLLVEYGHIWAVSRSLKGFELRDRVPHLFLMSAVR